MEVANPEVTLQEDAYGIPEEARETGQAMWNLVITVHGDDGKQYWINCTTGIHKPAATYGGVSYGATEALDMWTMGITSEIGKVVQSRTSIYKIADFPQTSAISWHPYPGGTLKLNKSEREVTIDLEDFHLACKDDKTWHFKAEDKENGMALNLVHTGVGRPHWYGKEKPEVYTPHSIASGYFWAGTVEGSITVDGRDVKVKGKGTRERYYAISASPVEGAWIDWMWFHFDEMFGGLVEHKLFHHKVLGLYLVDEKQDFPVGSFDIEHHDWAYLAPLGAFIPTHYKVTVEVEAGVLEMTADVVGCSVWGATGELPDCPIGNLHWEKVDGVFTYKDGRKKTLTNGLGGCLTHQWKPYPSLISLELDGVGAKGIKHMPKV